MNGRALGDALFALRAPRLDDPEALLLAVNLGHRAMTGKRHMAARRDGDNHAGRPVRGQATDPLAPRESGADFMLPTPQVQRGALAPIPRYCRAADQQVRDSGLGEKVRAHAGR